MYRKIIILFWICWALPTVPAQIISPDTEAPKLTVADLKSYNESNSPVISPGILFHEPDNKKPSYSGIYLGQSPPGDVPVRFAPVGLRANSTWFWHGSPRFSPDLSEMVFVKYYEATDKTEINYMKMTDGVWSNPVPPSFSNTDYIENNPFFSTSGDTLYFFSTRPGGPYFYVTRQGKGWSEPVSLPVQLPDSLIAGWNFFISATGELYLDLSQGTGNLDIYRSEMQDGQYLEPVKLGPEINTDYHDWGTSLDVLGRVMIFASKRPGGSGLHDLYISHKNGDGWTQSENLGSNINGANEDGYPSLSPDGLYLFFTTAKAGDLGYNPYWVRADAIDPILGMDDKPDEQPNAIGVSIYPNPARETSLVSFYLAKPEKVVIEMIDPSGRRIILMKEKCNAGQNHFNMRLDRNADGVYCIIITAGSLRKSKLLIVKN